MKFSSQFLTAIYRFREYNKLLLNKGGRVIWYFIVICAVCFCLKGGALLYSCLQAGGISGIANTYLPEFSIENGKLNCDEYNFEDKIAGVKIIVNTSSDFNASRDIIDQDTVVAVIADSTKLIVANPMEYQEIRFDDEVLQGLTKDKIVKFLDTSIFVKLMFICFGFMMFGAYLINYVIYVFLAVCLGNIINGFVKAQIRFSSMVKLGVYAITFPSLLNSVTSAVVSILGFYGSGDFNTLLFAVLGGVYMYLGLKNIKISNGYIVAAL